MTAGAMSRSSLVTQSKEDCNVDMQVFECNLDNSYFPSTCDNFSRHISDTVFSRLNCNASNNIDPTIDSTGTVTINQSQHPPADFLNRNGSNVINDILAGSTRPSLFQF